MVIAAVLLGCAPGPGEPGYGECEPYEPKKGCPIWLCYEIVDRERVDYWVEWGEEGRADCSNQLCTKEITQAAKKHCGVGDCRSDCCTVCAGSTEACGDGCLEEGNQCGASPGCACDFGEACVP